MTADRINSPNGRKVIKTNLFFKKKYHKINRETFLSCWNSSHVLLHAWYVSLDWNYHKKKIRNNDPFLSFNNFELLGFGYKRHRWIEYAIAFEPFLFISPYQSKFDNIVFTYQTLFFRSSTVPSKPLNLTVLEVTSTTITIGWRDPENLNGAIVGYRVFYIHQNQTYFATVRSGTGAGEMIRYDLCDLSKCSCLVHDKNN